MLSMTIQGKNVSVFPCEKPDAPAIYLNTVSGEGLQIYSELQKHPLHPLPDFSLIAISGLEWNHDLAPWDHPPVFKNTPAFTGGADNYLHLLADDILPAAESNLPGTPCWRGLAGYSLAGLFALYALYGTDAFSRIASVSGSLWFPGTHEYIASHPTKCLPDCVYFSLGDKESKTRNPVLKTVRENTESIHAYYQGQGIHTIFQLNTGNHYDHTAQRTAKGIAWLLTQ